MTTELMTLKDKGLVVMVLFVYCVSLSMTTELMTLKIGVACHCFH